MTDDVRRSSAEAELDEIDRTHDERPAQAAYRLRRLDAARLPAGRLGAFAFLLNHVIGEKHGAWPGAVQRDKALAEATTLATCVDADLERLLAPDAAEFFTQDHR